MTAPESSWHIGPLWVSRDDNGEGFTLYAIASLGPWWAEVARLTRRRWGVRHLYGGRALCLGEWVLTTGRES